MSGDDHGRFVPVMWNADEKTIRRWKIQITNYTAVNVDMGRTSLKESLKKRKEKKIQTSLPYTYVTSLATKPHTYSTNYIISHCGFQTFSFVPNTMGKSERIATKAKRCCGDGKEVDFKNANKLAARFLYFHFVVTLFAQQERSSTEM